MSAHHCKQTTEPWNGRPNRYDYRIASISMHILASTWILGNAWYTSDMGTSTPRKPPSSSSSRDCTVPTSTSILRESWCNPLRPPSEPINLALPYTTHLNRTTVPATPYRSLNIWRPLHLHQPDHPTASRSPHTTQPWESARITITQTVTIQTIHTDQIMHCRRSHNPQCTQRPKSGAVPTLLPKPWRFTPIPTIYRRFSTPTWTTLTRITLFEVIPALCWTVRHIQRSVQLQPIWCPVYPPTPTPTPERRKILTPLILTLANCDYKPTLEEWLFRRWSPLTFMTPWYRPEQSLTPEN